MKKMEAQAQKSFGNVIKLNDETVKKINSSHANGLNALFGTASLDKFNSKLGETIKGFAVGEAALGSFGGALGALGPEGAAAAAAIGVAVTAAKYSIDQALKVADDAKSIKVLAETLGTTTTAVQEFAYVASTAGIPIDKMNTSLKGFNEVLGQVQSGIARGNIVKAFAALDITPEQLRALGTVQNALPVVVAALAKLPASERAGIEERIKLDPETVNGIISLKDSLPDVIQKAHQFGVVMDESLINRAAAASDELHTLSFVMNKEMTIAFANLLPLLVKITGLLANMTQNVSDFIQQFAKLGDQNTDHVETTLKGVQANIAQREARLAATKGVPEGYADLGFVGRSYAENDLAKQKAVASVLQSELGSRAGVAGGQHFGDKPDKAAPQLVSGRTPKIHDNTDDLTKTANEDLAAADKALQEAYKNLTNNIDARADFELKANQDDLTKQTTKLEADRERVAKDKSLDAATKQILEAKIDQAIVDSQLAALAKSQLINRTRDQDNAEADLKFETEMDELKARQITAQMQLSTNAQAKADAELDSFRQQQEDALEAYRQQQKNNDQITQAQKNQAIAAMQAAQNAEYNAKADQLTRQANPIYNYANPQESLGTDLQNTGVDFFKGMTDGLTAVITGTKSVSAAFKDMATSIVTDLVRIGIQRTLVDPLANALFPVKPPTATQGQISFGPLGQGGGGPSGTLADPVYVAPSPLGSAGFSGLSLGGNLADGAANGGGGNPLSFLASIASIFGFASGTDFAPGGLSMVGENGPELLNLPRGAGVINNGTLRSALATGTGSRAQAPVYNLTTVVNADDSVMTATIQHWIASGMVQAVGAAQQMTLKQSASNARQRLV